MAITALKGGDTWLKQKSLQRLQRVQKRVLKKVLKNPQNNHSVI